MVDLTNKEDFVTVKQKSGSLSVPLHRAANKNKPNKPPAQSAIDITTPHILFIP